MMKRISKTILALLPVLALAGAASAQFSFKTAEGKTIGNKNAPTYLKYYTDADAKGKPSDAMYVTWEKERVKISKLNLRKDGSIYNIDEFYFYYESFDPKEAKADEDHKEWLRLKVADSKPIPQYSYYEDRSYGKMSYEFTLYFPEEKNANEFLVKITDKKLDQALDLSYTPGPRLVIKDFVFPEPKPAPAPSRDDSSGSGEAKPGAQPASPAPSPKKVEDVSVELRNKSNSPIEIVIKEGRGSATTFSLSARGSRSRRIKVGAEIRLKSSGQLLLTITESMNKTEQVIAK